MLTIAGGIILAFVIWWLFLAMFSGFTFNPGAGCLTMIFFGAILGFRILIFG